jgi:hypothetical protein
MTIAETRIAPETAAETLREEDRAAALKMMRDDAVTYMTALFDWLDSGKPGTEYITTYACLDATEKRFHEVLTWIVAEAEGKHFSAERLCSGKSGCGCLNCRYPAEDPDEDMRPAWTRLMANVRAAGRPATAPEQRAEPC